MMDEETVAWVEEDTMALMVSEEGVEDSVEKETEAWVED